MPSPNSAFVAVAAGGFHSLGLKSDGSVVAWGAGQPGQSGHPHYGQGNVPSPNMGFVAIAAGEYHSLGLKSDAPSSLAPQTASLRVTIQPAEAVAEGGQWRRAGTSTWHESGDTEAAVPVGVYRIEFKDAVSWVKLGQLVYVSPLGTDSAIQGYRPYFVGEAKQTSDSTVVRIDPAIVSAVWGDVFYAEGADRSSGIRVEKASHGMARGDSVRVIGPLATTSDGERFIQASSVTDLGSGSVGPLGMPNRSLGGGDWNYEPGASWPQTLSGQKGVLGGFGLNNIGLLVRTWSRIVERDPATPVAWFKIDDGSGANVKCVVPSGVTVDPGWVYVGVTGISSCEKPGDDLLPVVRVRDGDDIQVYLVHP